MTDSDSTPDLVTVQLPAEVVANMRSHEPEPRLAAGWREWVKALVEHNPEPVKPGDWVTWGAGLGTWLCLGDLLGRLALIGQFEMMIWTTGGDGPAKSELRKTSRPAWAADPEIRARYMEGLLD